MANITARMAAAIPRTRTTLMLISHVSWRSILRRLIDSTIPRSCLFSGAVQAAHVIFNGRRTYLSWLHSHPHLMSLIVFSEGGGVYFMETETVDPVVQAAAALSERENALKERPQCPRCHAGELHRAHLPKILRPL